MTCPIESRHPEMLLAYAGGELGMDAARALELHLATCDACSSVVTEQVAVWKALDEWEPPVISADFNRRLYGRIEEGLRRSWWQRLTSPLREMPLRQALPLSATLGLLLMAGLILQHPDSLAPAPKPQGKIVRAEQVEKTLDDLDLLRQFDSPKSAESGHTDAM